MTLLPVPVAPAELQDSERLTAANAFQDALLAAREFALEEKAARTRSAYAAAFRDFERFCSMVERQALPAEPATIAAYLAHLAERRLKASTIQQRLSSIRYAHKLRGFEPPTHHGQVQAVHRGIRRRIGTRSSQKFPVVASVIAKMLKRTPVDTLAGKRDRAILLIGFAAALRRSELVALNIEDIELAAEGLRITIRRSKVDQEGRGAEVAIPTGRRLMPVDALRAWLSAANITAGPIFRRIGKGDRLTADRLTPQSVALIVKRYAKAAKLDPALYAGHSLRAGLVTEALANGADVFAVADQGRWAKLETVRGYDRRAKAFASNVGRKFL